MNRSAVCLSNRFLTAAFAGSRAGRCARAATLWFAALAAQAVRAEEPGTAYIFPAGGQRGTAVTFKVGGYFLHGQAGFEMLGPGVRAEPTVKETDTVWFEGPVIPQPASQQKEDYPRDHLGRVEIAPDAARGARFWRVWTSQGATPSLRFTIGDLPEIVEQEFDGPPRPVEATLPVTINGRIFPREDVDVWSFAAHAGQPVTAHLQALEIGSPLEARLQALDAAGRVLAEATAQPGRDPQLRFTPPADGVYQVRLHDLSFGGLQHYVYRLTLTAGPWVDGVYPLGARRGAASELQASGQGVPASLRVEPPADAGETHRVSWEVNGKRTNELLLAIDDLPEALEQEPNQEPAQARETAAPGVANGRIDRPGDIDHWVFRALKDQTLSLDLAAARLGSPLDSVLVVLDVQGKELARNDDLSGSQTDSQLVFKAPADGVYTVRVEERFRGRGGPEFAYRLYLRGPAEPGFRLTLASDVATAVREAAGDPAAPKKPGKLTVQVERSGGFAGDVELQVEGLPPGVKVEGTLVKGNQAKADLTFTAAPEARIAAARLTIRGRAKIGEAEAVRTAATQPARGEQGTESVLFAVALPTPFKVVGEYASGFTPRGAVLRRTYRVERGGYAGPLTVRLADRQARHLQGVRGPTIMVPADAVEFEYPLALPPWMELGRTSRTCLAALGTIREPDGSEHIVSFTSQAQNDQMVTLVGPGQLALDLERGSALAVAGGALEARFTVRRGPEIAGSPVRVEAILPPQLGGVETASVLVPGDAAQGTLTLRIGAAAGPWPQAILIRAVTTGRADPCTAESRLELVGD